MAYRIVSELGRGGCGIVFRAFDPALEREVALKVLPVSLARDETRVQRFHHEVKIMSRLAHPNLVRIFGSGEQDGALYFAMEIIEGTDLARVIAASGAQPLRDTVHWMAQAAEGLAYLHDRGVTHRDIKPANLIVGPSGHTTVMDLGMAKDPSLTAITEEGVVLGTFRFMAPEMLKSEPSGPPVDVWALALTTHEVLCGGPWCESGSTPEMLRRVLQEPPPDPTAERDDIPAWLIDLQARALHKDPTARLTAAQYRDGLKAGLHRVARSAAEPVPARTIRGVAPDARKASGQHGRLGGPRLLAGTVGAPARGSSRRLGGPAAVGLALAALTLLAVVGSTDRSRTVGPPRAGPSLAWGEVSFPGHRRLSVALRGRSDASLTVDLVARDRTLATTAVSPGDRTAVLSDLPAGVDGHLRARQGDGRPALDPLPTRTPDSVSVLNLVCLPTDRDVLVDFDLPVAGAYTVEVRPATRPGRPITIRREDGGRWFQHLFTDLAPDSRYALEVRIDGRWGGLVDYRFATATTKHSQRVRDFLAGHSFLTVSTEWACDFWRMNPDRRAIPHLLKLIERTPPDRLGELRKTAWVAEQQRSLELADRLAPLVEKLGEMRLKTDFIRALTYARHPRAAELGRTHLARAQSELQLESLARAIATGGTSADCDLIARRVADNPASAVLATHMISADRNRARQHFTTWFEAALKDAASARRRAGDSVTVSSDLEEEPSRRFADREGAWGQVAVRGLAALGEPRDVALLSRVLGSTERPDLCGLAAASLTMHESAGARGALLAALRRRPDHAHFLWAAGRLGIQEAAPLVAEVLGSSRRPASRRDAALVLGLLKDRAHCPALRRALLDPDDAGCQAAAVALARCGDREAISDLERLALSPRDPTGVAAWALAELESRRSLGALGGLLARLTSAAAGSDPSRLAVVAWAVGRLDDGRFAPGLRGLAGDQRQPLMVRLAARQGVEWNGPGRDADRPTHTLVPMLIYDRTGVVLDAGESVEVGGVEAWSYPVGAGRKGGEALSRLSLFASVGEHHQRLARGAVRVVAEHPAEVVLTPYEPAPLWPGALPLASMRGMAWVAVRR